MDDVRQNIARLMVMVTAFMSLALAGILLLNPDISFQNSDALVSGRVEKGYEYVGYVVSDNQKICAATLLDETTVLTAAHCLNYEAGDIFNFGVGEFSTDSEDLTAINLIKFAAGYDPETGDGPDLAIARLQKETKLEAYPRIVTPIEKCEASIVAYGAGVQNKVTTKDMFIKKSGEGCVKAITSNFLIQFNDEVGICFGDSGGPIFRARGSDEIIGVLSGGLVEPNADNIKCNNSNIGLATNVDFFSRFVDDRDFESTESESIRVVEPQKLINIEEDVQSKILAEQSEETGQSFINIADVERPSSIFSTSVIIYASMALVTMLTLFIVIKYLRVSKN